MDRFPHPLFLEALDYAVQVTRASASTTPLSESPSSTCHLRNQGSGINSNFAGGVESKDLMPNDSGGGSRNSQSETLVQGARVRKCRTWQPATPEQASALLALRGIVGPLRASEVARQLDWTVKRARRWIEFFRAKELLESGVDGFVWTDRSAA